MTNIDHITSISPSHDLSELLARRSAIISAMAAEGRRLDELETVRRALFEAGRPYREALESSGYAEVDQRYDRLFDQLWTLDTTIAEKGAELPTNSPLRIG